MLPPARALPPVQSGRNGSARSTIWVSSVSVEPRRVSAPGPVLACVRFGVQSATDA